jgi:hypothetical protein
LKPDSWKTVELVYRFKSFADIELLKPEKKHADRSFYSSAYSGDIAAHTACPSNNHTAAPGLSPGAKAWIGIGSAIGDIAGLAGIAQLVAKAGVFGSVASVAAAGSGAGIKSTARAFQAQQSAMMGATHENTAAHTQMQQSAMSRIGKGGFALHLVYRQSNVPHLVSQEGEQRP